MSGKNNREGLNVWPSEKKSTKNLYFSVQSMKFYDKI